MNEEVKNEKEMTETEKAGFKVGTILGYTIGLCLASIILAATCKTIFWIWTL